jgi:hypothetical protein
MKLIETKFIFTKCQNTKVAKFTNKERTEILNIVANLTIKRIPDPLIVKHLQRNGEVNIKEELTVFHLADRYKPNGFCLLIYFWFLNLNFHI